MNRREPWEKRTVKKRWSPSFWDSFAGCCACLLWNGKKREREGEIAALLSDLSHQLKTPLAIILMNTEILKEEKLTKKEQEMFWNGTRSRRKRSSG